MSAQEYEFNFDIEHMEKIINEPSITVPTGLNIDQFRDWVNSVIIEKDEQIKYLKTIKPICPKCQSEQMQMLSIYLSSDPKSSKWKCRECHTKIEIIN